MNIEIFDQLQDNDWDLSKKDRSIDQQKTKFYINKLREEDCEEVANYAEDILNKTIYVPFNEFKTSLIECFNLFKKEIGDEPFYILCETDIINSEHWFIILLWKEIKKINFKGFIDTGEIVPDKKYNILLIDDAIYSGNTMSDRITDFLYTTDLSKNEYVLRNNKLNLNPNNFNFHIVCPYVSKLGKEFIERYNNINWYNFIFYNLVTMKPNDGYKEEVMFRFCSSYDNIPLYFDHKVACDESTFYTIYIRGLVPSTREYIGSLLKDKYSRKKIEEFEKLYTKNSNETLNFGQEIKSEYDDIPLPKEPDSFCLLF